MTGRQWRTITAIAAGIVLLGLGAATAVSRHTYLDGLNVDLRLYAVVALVIGLAAAGSWIMAMAIARRGRR